MINCYKLKDAILPKLQGIGLDVVVNTPKRVTVFPFQPKINKNSPKTCLLNFYFVNLRYRTSRDYSLQLVQ